MSTPSPECPMATKPHGEHKFSLLAGPLAGAEIDCAGFEPFNLHGSRTADGITITLGLHVFTNEMRPGIVLEDDITRCCGDAEHRAAQVQIEGVWFTDHPAGNALTEPLCQRCRHNHWFKVRYLDGSVISMDGERLSTTFRTYEGNTLRAIEEYETAQHNQYVEDSLDTEEG